MCTLPPLNDTNIRQIRNRTACVQMRSNQFPEEGYTRSQFTPQSDQKVGSSDFVKASRVGKSVLALCVEMKIWSAGTLRG